MLVHSNRAFSRVFGRGQSCIGQVSRSYLDPSVADVSKKTEALIPSGSSTWQCEHMGNGSDGYSYAMRTHKQNLLRCDRPTVAILGITRPKQS